MPARVQLPVDEDLRWARPTIRASRSRLREQLSRPARLLRIFPLYGMLLMEQRTRRPQLRLYSSRLPRDNAELLQVNKVRLEAVAAAGRAVVPVLEPLQRRVTTTREMMLPFKRRSAIATGLLRMTGAQ